jgi:hypothetical protein
MVFCITGKFPRCTPARDLHEAFKIPYVYDLIAKWRRQEKKVTPNHEHLNVRDKRQSKVSNRKHKRFKFGGGQAYDISSD